MENIEIELNKRLNAFFNIKFSCKPEEATLFIYSFVRSELQKYIIVQEQNKGMNFEKIFNNIYLDLETYYLDELNIFLNNIDNK